MVEPPSTATSPSPSSSTSSSTSPAASPPRWKFWASRPVRKPSSDDDSSAAASNPAPLPYFQLFRYTSARVRLLLFFSLLNAAAHGIMLPVLTLLFGRVIDDATPIIRGIAVGVSDLESLSSALADTTRLFLILSFVVWILSFFQLFLSLRAANAIGNQLRHAFFSSLLRLQPSFYDDARAGALTVLVVNDVNLIQAAVGDKLATAVQYITTFAAGIVVGFIKGWALTLVILAVTPVLLISGSVFGNASADATGDSLGSYADASAIASETLGQIRTVTAFSAQSTEQARYNRAVKQAYNKSARASIMSGVGLGVAMFFILCIYGLAFWFGSTRVEAGDTSAGDVLVTFFALTLGASSLGTAGPAFKSFSKARAAAPRVFEIIDTISEIDPMDDDAGQIIPADQLHGRIAFNRVDFNYANRKFDDDVATTKSSLVLDKFDLDIPAGSSEALVGKSGCGKSTVAKLVQRMYDPSAGTVTLDGVDLRELNVRWLRSQIGVVAQMPSLFMMSIRDNIALGAGVTFERDPDTKTTIVTQQEVSQDDIVAAAKLANAHDFISKLPEGYDTMLGERGAMLSGGQKQRVCIARALVRNPRILVLDESTASLDTASERIVQEALERASSGRTTVTIAHRLSTIRKADSISCIENGDVVERGKHEDLIGREGGFYRGLFELQNIERAKMEAEKAEEVGDEVVTVATATAGGSTGHDEKSTTTKGVGKDSLFGKGVGEEEEGQQAAVDKGVFFRTLRFNFPEWQFLILGTVGALLSAVVWPISSIALVEMIYILLEEEIDKGAVRKWSLAFVVLAVVALVGNAGQHGLLGVSGERLTKRLRQEVFAQLLRQEMGYFDMQENSLGRVTTLLASDAGMVKGLTGELMGIGLNIVGSLVCAMVIAFIACWRLTLVVLAIIPGVALGGYFEMQASAGIDSGARSEFAEANAVAAEAVENVSTVRSLGREGTFVDKYDAMIGRTSGSKLKKDLITGMAYGFSEFCQYLIWYATFKAGAEFNEFCSFKDVLQSSMALLFGAITLGNVSIFAPDVASSKVSATAVYRLLDRSSAIDPTEASGSTTDDDVRGDVKADGVFFEYPRRPDVAVLRGLSVAIEQGRTLAIVGTSGHGKSTIIGLLERFYDIRKGCLTLDEHEVRDMSVTHLRKSFGLVSQEPELFNRSVYDNIAYGLPHDGSVAVTDEMVHTAARIANAHDFICTLPQGYDTCVGARGDKLSGGQKQRIAIARSVIRKPSVLLLDEATSALDSESERVVQKALENAGQGRTTVVVAHRLSTVKDADLIVVVRRGRIVEAGTHDVLLAKNGHYAKLVESQLTEV